MMLVSIKFSAKNGIWDINMNVIYKANITAKIDFLYEEKSCDFEAKLGRLIAVLYFKMKLWDFTFPPPSNFWFLV